ncbi:sulfite exporter TauE/SafE family protein [Aestuariicoccus sp. KMU-90]|uniref:Probable membrane transporter protein n=1 Tax=Thetidibacter halocola TaxID=2827239 RepID=A0A8J8B801_9RHOB|nr:sulfite exporter TauE/SafE family protein [Thetidibacter halocola]
MHFAEGHLAGLVWTALALVLGGVLKGATGAGAPIVAVPVIALHFDVPTAVVVMVLPSFATNLVQLRSFWSHLPRGAFPWLFASGGLLGAWIGTLMLAHVSPSLLLAMVAGVVFLYVGFRLARPGWALDPALAGRIVLPVAGVAGVLQGATGVSAPVSITFLNAMRLARPVFVATISVFFLAMTLAQAPTMLWYGLLTPERVAGSVAALAPLLAGMPLGAALARRWPPQVFDRAILALLSVLAVKLVFDAMT